MTERFLKYKFQVNVMVLITNGIRRKRERENGGRKEVGEEKRDDKLKKLVQIFKEK